MLFSIVSLYFWHCQLLRTVHVKYCIILTMGRINCFGVCNCDMYESSLLSFREFKFFAVLTWIQVLCCLYLNSSSLLSLREFKFFAIFTWIQVFCCPCVNSCSLLSLREFKFFAVLTWIQFVCFPCVDSYVPDNCITCMHSCCFLSSSLSYWLV